MDKAYMLEAVWISDNYKRVFICVAESREAAKTYVDAITTGTSLPDAKWIDSQNYSTSNNIVEGSWNYYYVITEIPIYKVPSK
jgi:hypothetical protein